MKIKAFITFTPGLELHEKMGIMNCILNNQRFKYESLQDPDLFAVWFTVNCPMMLWMAGRAELDEELKGLRGIEVVRKEYY